jgi:hypothetical protein
MCPARRRKRVTSFPCEIERPAIAFAIVNCSSTVCLGSRCKENTVTGIPCLSTIFDHHTDGSRRHWAHEHEQRVLDFRHMALCPDIL